MYFSRDTENKAHRAKELFPTVWNTLHFHSSILSNDSADCIILIEPVRQTLMQAAPILFLHFELYYMHVGLWQVHNEV